jgi:hypothetical protein
MVGAGLGHEQGVGRLSGKLVGGQGARATGQVPEQGGFG